VFPLSRFALTLGVAPLNAKIHPWVFVPVSIDA
jgi:hypothetical protein